jgi:nitroreductase
MELSTVLRHTPTVREFAPRPVDPAVLHEILDLARFAPSGGNRQGWHVIVVSDGQLRRRLRDLYVLGWREYMGHVERGLVPFAPDLAGIWHGPAIDLEAARSCPQPHLLADHLDEVPVLLVVTVDLTGLAVTDNGLDRQSIVGGASIYPFVHNILLAASDRGLAGVLTTVLCRQEPAVAELLGIRRPHAMAAVVAMGYPLQPPKRPRRLRVEEFATHDRFDGQPYLVGGEEPEPGASHPIHPGAHPQ